MEQFRELLESKIPERVNLVARKPHQFSFFVSLSKSNGTEDNQVVVDVKIWHGFFFKQSFVVGVDIEQITIDLRFPYRLKGRS